MRPIQKRPDEHIEQLSNSLYDFVSSENRKRHNFISYQNFSESNYSERSYQDSKKKILDSENICDIIDFILDIEDKDEIDFIISDKDCVFKMMMEYDLNFDDPIDLLAAAAGNECSLSETYEEIISDKKMFFDLIKSLMSPRYLFSKISKEVRDFNSIFREHFLIEGKKNTYDIDLFKSVINSNLDSLIENGDEILGIFIDNPGIFDDKHFRSMAMNAFRELDLEEIKDYGNCEKESLIDMIKEFYDNIYPAHTRARTKILSSIENLLDK